MVRFFIYLFSFLLFASPSALYLLFRKEVQDKKTKNLKVLFLLKFFLFDLLFYGVGIIKGIEDKDITMIFFVFLFFSIVNLFPALIYSVYYPKLKKNKTDKNIIKENKDDIISQIQKEPPLFDIDVEKPIPVSNTKSKKNKIDKNITKKNKDIYKEETAFLENKDNIISQVLKEPLSLEELVQLLTDEYVDTGRVLSFEYQGERDLIPLNREVIIRKVYQKNNIYYMNVIDIDTKRPKMFRLDRIISINLE